MEETFCRTERTENQGEARFSKENSLWGINAMLKDVKLQDLKLQHLFSEEKHSKTSSNRHTSTPKIKTTNYPQEQKYSACI